MISCAIVCVGNTFKNLACFELFLYICLAMPKIVQLLCIYTRELLTESSLPISVETQELRQNCFRAFIYSNTFSSSKSLLEENIFASLIQWRRNSQLSVINLLLIFLSENSPIFGCMCILIGTFKLCLCDILISSDNWRPVIN